MTIASIIEVKTQKIASPIGQHENIPEHKDPLNLCRHFTLTSPVFECTYGWNVALMMGEIIFMMRFLVISTLIDTMFIQHDV